MKAARPPLLATVLAALGGLTIQEGPIEGKKGEQVHGLQEGKRIWINPAYSTVGTLIHETLHSLHPEWTENYVANRESFLLNRMTSSEVQHIYGLYRERMRPTRRTKKS